MFRGLGSRGREQKTRASEGKTTEDLASTAAKKSGSCRRRAFESFSLTYLSLVPSLPSTAELPVGD